MKPESFLLDPPMDHVQATLANGVLCGEHFREMMRPKRGWPTFIDFTGRLFSTFPPGGDDDAVTRIPTNDRTRESGNAGKRILGLAINTWFPDDSVLLIDDGEDLDNPGAQECRIVIGLVRNTLHPELQDILRSWRLMP